MNISLHLGHGVIPSKQDVVAIQLCDMMCGVVVFVFVAVLLFRLRLDPSRPMSGISCLAPCCARASFLPDSFALGWMTYLI